MIRQRSTQIVCIAVLIWCCAPNFNSAFAFQNGTNGVDGVAGDPGTDGSDGENGMFVTDIPNDPMTTWRTTLGGSGGNGGNGGDGVDGNDPGNLANGGNAGEGGNGGNAFGVYAAESKDTANMFAQGGHGGSGGVFGHGTTPAQNGVGGNGGTGGDATAFASAPSEIFSIAIGGNGGNAYGQGQFGGNGGLAKVIGTVRNRGSIQGIQGRAFGGHGGFGFVGATGGDGASVEFGSDPINLQMAVSNQQDAARYLILEGYGGNGGGSENGVAGNAGMATMDVNGLVSVLSTQPTGSHLTSVMLRGGYGGIGIASGNQHISGRHGAAATIQSADQPFETKGSTSWSFDLRGGNGGSALGRKNSGNGGNGATASFSSESVFDNRIDDGSLMSRYSRMTLGATVRGGDGGNALGTGWAGNGADVELENKFTLRTNRNSRLFLGATGGSGGWGRRNGNGGNARIESIEAIEQPDAVYQNENKSSSVRAKAYGGHAGLGKYGLTSATGGNAFASVTQSTPFSIDVDVESVGGTGNLGLSGFAFARAEGNTTVDGGAGGTRELFRIATANAIASAARIDELGVLPSIGTDSFAEARATNDTYGVTSANAQSHSGWGFLQSGSSTAVASAESHNGGITDATSHAFAAGDRNRISQNYAISTATAVSSTKADAIANATSVGHFSKNEAIARIVTPMGRASSEAHSSTITWAHDANIKNSAYFEASNGQSASISSSSFVGFRQPEYSYLNFGHVSATSFVVVPDQNIADQIVANHSDLADVFVDDPDADILGIGSFAGGFTGNEPAGNLSVDSTVNLSLELQHFHDDKHLMLGLFGIDSTGAGFSDMSLNLSFDDRSIVDETFSTLGEAEAFFDSPIYDLGALNNNAETVNFLIEFSLTADNPMDSFQFGFVFGNADPRAIPKSSVNARRVGIRFSPVPEPSAMILGWLLMPAFLRRNRSRG